MKVSFGLVTLVATLLTCAVSQPADKQEKSPAKNAGNSLSELYVTLRNIAFPKFPLSDGVTYNRFVLLSPGKVLNFLDYYPGEEYERSLLKSDKKAPEAMIPPKVMEKWFDIADVMVGADPFSGGITGKSFSETYKTIVSQMDVLGIQTKASEAQARYNKAHDYLNHVVPDPTNVTENITVLALYDQFQNEYASCKLDMEEKIEKARLDKTAVEYELWFQRNYPALNARVESSYVKWLAFGDKNVVELYKSYLDSASAGSEIEEARMALRGSGVGSLDRTRTIYPVSFEPGNWYHYLLPKMKGPSRDMLLSKKHMLESQVDSYQAMIDFSGNATHSTSVNNALSNLEGKVNATQKKNTEISEQAMVSMMKCVNKNTTAPENDKTSDDEESGSGGSETDPCKNSKVLNQQAVQAILKEGIAKSRHANTEFLFSSSSAYNSFLQSSIDSINIKITEIENELKDVKPYMGDLVESRNFQDVAALANETSQNLDDAWMQFEYNSDSSHTSSEQEKKSLNVAGSIGGQTSGKGIQVSGQFGKSDASMQQSLNSASLKVSGELLRVVIKRPWFKQSIFSASSLTFMQRDEANQLYTYVSPGPGTEKQLRDAIGGSTSSNKQYILPEYVTSFLLARNIKMEFSGVDSNMASSSMQMAAGGTLKGSFNMFNLDASGDYNDEKQSVTADKTSSGLAINIPGAQIIGYFTEVLQRFPATQ